MRVSAKDLCGLPPEALVQATYLNPETERNKKEFSKMNDGRNYYGKITLGKAGFFVKIAIFAVVVCILVSSLSLLIEYNRLSADKAELEEKISDAEVRVAELKYELDAPMDEEYILRVARKKLGLVLPEEIIYYTDIETGN